MSNKKKSNRTLDIDVSELITKIFKYAFLASIIICVGYGYFVIYNPEKQNYIKKTNYAFLKIQNELTEIMKTNKQLFINAQQLAQEYEEGKRKAQEEFERNEPKFSAQFQKRIKKRKAPVYEFRILEDEICKAIGKNIAQNSIANCKNDSQNIKQNFTIKKTKIAIYGLERPWRLIEGEVAKEILIDINGEDKGSNTVGEDRIPVRIYASGTRIAMVTPVNCNIGDYSEFGFVVSDLCQNMPEPKNFLTTNSPFGFDLVQVGSDKGDSRTIMHNAPYTRADCGGFGGDLGTYDYCSDKQLDWMSACYDEFPCAIQLSKK